MVNKMDPLSDPAEFLNSYHFSLSEFNLEAGKAKVEVVGVLNSKDCKGK